MGTPRVGAECMLAGREGSYAHACCALTERCSCPTFSIYERLRFARMQAIGLMFLAYRVKFPRPANPTATTTSDMSSSAEIKKLFVHCIMSPCFSCFTLVILKITH
jgi:hypothetical protein